MVNNKKKIPRWLFALIAILGIAILKANNEKVGGSE
jgi:hypothetical protein